MEGRCNSREVCGTNSDIIVLGIELSNQKQMKIKYTVALDGRVLMNFHTTTNQKQFDSRERWCDHRGAREDANRSAIEWGVC
jgi:hypothetical protein